MSPQKTPAAATGNRQAPRGGTIVVTPRKGGLLRRAIRVVGFLTCIGVIAGAVAFGVGYTHYSQDLPKFTSVDDYDPPLATRVYSVDGRLIGEFGIERRRLIPYERIPKRLIQAFLATEDKNFFEHGGVYFPGLVRAVVFKLIGKSKKLGGTSTITQQVAKSLLIQKYQRELGYKEGFKKGTARTIERKAKEMILARRLDATLPKEDILWLYLSQSLLGHGAYGIQAASEHYFRKDVEQLTLPEMALLAGLPQAPSRYSPLKDPKAARQRVNTVLARMKQNGFITEAERAEAAAVDLVEIVKPRDDAFGDTAPYFAEHVRRYIHDTYGAKALYEGGLEVHTTLDLERQRYAEDAMIKGLREVDKRQGWRGPVASIPKDKRDKAAKIVKTENAEHLVEGKDGKKQIPLGAPVVALVEKVDGRTQRVTIDVGHEKGIIPLAGMRWAREPNPNLWWERHLQENVRNVVKAGDVVLVTRTTLKGMRALAMDRRGLESIPTKKDAPKEADMTLYALDQVPRVEGALIAMNPHTGYVEAMIGGYAFEKSEFNRAFQACRQPGSVFKPIVYSAAVVREDYNPATMILDTPITVRDTDIGKSWKPQNFEHAYKGEVTAREALMNSMNVPALKTMEKVGIKNVLTFAKKMGIETELKEELGTAIGSSCVNLWELTHVYTTWARMGLRPEPVFIKRIVNKDGKVIEEHASPNDPWQSHEERLDSLYRKLLRPPVRVLDERDAFIVNYLLNQVATRGTAARASRLGHPVAGKTGTTNDSFDTWFAGFTPSLVTTVWVGYDTYEYPMSAREQGGRTSLPIWLSFMSRALKDIEEEKWPPPEGICNARVDGKTGYRVYEDIPGSFIAPFRCGDEPKAAPIAGGLSLEEAVKQGGI